MRSYNIINRISPRKQYIIRSIKFLKIRLVLGTFQIYLYVHHQKQEQPIGQEFYGNWNIWMNLEYLSINMMKTI